MRVERGWIAVEAVRGCREAGQPIVRAAPGPCSLTLPIYIPCVVAISITLAALEAIKSTLPDDADAFPPEPDERGESGSWSTTRRLTG